MGSELVNSSSPPYGGMVDDNPAPFSYAEQFHNQFPYYLAIGMSYDQYWNCDCCLARDYRKAHELEIQERNQELWIQGAYIYEALIDVAPILQAFAKKGTKPTPYPSEPYALTKKEARERKERDERRRVEKMKAKMAEWAVRTNAQMANKAMKKEKEAKGDG